LYVLIRNTASFPRRIRLSRSARQLRQLRKKRALPTNERVELLSIEANEAQHDAVLDYYGRRLATCSSIKIFEVEGENHRLVETLKGYVTAA
jgi:hypothetical protein